MSWAEIKKAINSDLSTPLDELLKNATYGLSAIKTALGDGTVPVVKSVQSGTASPYKDPNYKVERIAVTISSVNINKCLIVLDGIAVGYQNGNVIAYWEPYVKSVTANKLYIGFAGGLSNMAVDTINIPSSTYANVYTARVSWQVIEFY